MAALAEARRYAEAFDLALAVEPYLPGDPTLTGVMSVISDTISVTTEPPGATGLPQTLHSRGRRQAASRRLLGTSPLTNVRIARGEYVLSIEKEGYAPSERTVSGVAMRAGALTITPPPIRIVQRLLPASSVPARMVFVPGGDYRLALVVPSDRSACPPG